MRAFFITVLAIIVPANLALLDIAQNVCDFPDDTSDTKLQCFMRTLQSDLNQANDNILNDIEDLTVVCSDAFFYESILRPKHLGPLEKMSKLKLEYCKIRQIPNQAFAGLSNLKSLAINSHNSEWSSILMDMEVDSLNGLQTLEHLDLSYNNIWSLPTDSFKNVLNLKTLNMSHNHLLDLSDLGLHQEETTSQIRQIDVSNNFISSLRSSDLNLKSLEKLDLSKNRLTYLSDSALYGLSGSLKILNLADNELAALPPTVFNKSQQLQELHLQNNSLTLVTPELLSDLSQLKFLNLSYNLISSHLLSSGTFGGLKSLQVLDLSHNRLTDLHVDLFTELPELRELYLDGNLIKRAEWHAKMPKLTKLSLADNKMELVEGLDNLKNLTHLNLSGNKLEEISLNLETLQELSLSRNQFKAVPELTQCSNLKSIDLGENQISEIWPETFKSQESSLYALRLTGNALTMISNQTFGNMTHLHLLNLASNQIEVIPQGTFDGLQSLRGLRLDNNALADLNGIVASLGDLQWLNVSSNGLEWFDFAFIPHSLEWLDISHNEIAELGNFYHLQNFNLHTLEASHNRISSLDGQAALPAKGLQWIQLQYNSIFKVEAHTFAQLAYLHSVDLRHNQIQGLSKESLRKAIQVHGPQLPQVLLQGNPLVCDCHLEWLPSINTGSENSKSDDHLRVADLGELECQLNQDSDESTVQETTYLVTQVPEGNFLCSYTTHCFDLCRCCDFYACDCRMQCPSGCSCMHDATWSRNIIKCSAQNQTNVPLLIPMDATQLYLDGNNLGHVGQQHFLGRQRLQELYLNNSGVTSIGHSAFTGLTGLKSLDLSHNSELRELKGFEFSQGLTDLEELKLDHCGLVYINDVTFEPLVSLKKLTLDHNLLTSFPVWRLDTSLTQIALQSLTLAQNVWSCECDFIAPFNDFLQSHISQVLDYEQIQCVSENAVTLHQKLCHENQVNLAIIEESGNLDLPAILVPTLISIGVIILGILVILVFKKHIDKWLYQKSSEVYESSRSTTSTHPEIASTAIGVKMFDLYISYAKKDAEFVDHNLAPTLEHGPRSSTYRLCLHHRDSPVSSSVYDTVSMASEASAKTLIVLSKTYLAEEWPNVKNAILESLQGGPKNAEKLVILTIDDDITESYLRLASASELIPFFLHYSVKWGAAGFLTKLRFFLPEPVHTTFQRTVTLRSIQQQQYYQMYHQNEHLYHYIAENPQSQPLYHTLDNQMSPNNRGKSHPALVLALQQSFENPVMVNRQLGICHSHSLSTSSGQRLLTNPEEYIV